ncbi:MAG: hypothetical protein ACPHER_11575, partial [Nevskiales bacterium]
LQNRRALLYDGKPPAEDAQYNLDQAGLEGDMQGDIDSAYEDAYADAEDEETGAGAGEPLQ